MGLLEKEAEICWILFFSFENEKKRKEENFESFRFFFSSNSWVVVETIERDPTLLVAHCKVAAGRAEVKREHLTKGRLARGEIGERRPARNVDL